MVCVKLSKTSMSESWSLRIELRRVSIRDNSRKERREKNAFEIIKDDRKVYGNAIVLPATSLPRCHFFLKFGYVGR